MSSPLDELSEDQLEHLRDSVAEGVSWDGIASWLRASGVPTSEVSVRRWARRNGIKKDHVRVGSAARAEAIARHEAAQSGEIDLQSRVEFLEAELKQADKALKKVRERDNRDAILGELVQLAVREYDVAPLLPPPAIVAPREVIGTPQEFLAHISDLHYGEMVDPALAMGVEYSPEIARRRMAYLRDKIIRYAELRPYPIGKLHVAYIGDMVSGVQHEDLDTSNALGMMDQALDVAAMCYQQMTDFAAAFPYVEATFITGNHGRMHKQTRHKQRYENWDYLAGRMLQEMCRMGLDDRVTVNVPRGSREIIEVAGRRVMLMHGDGIKANSFAGIPFYGLKQKRDATQALLRGLEQQQIDQISMGHFHQPIWWPGDCSILMNGAIKGGDEYVMDTRLASTPPVQLLQEWHPKHGVTSLNHIDLGHIN